MIELVPLQIDVSSRGVTLAHTVFALGLLLTAFVLLTVARYKMQFVGLSDEQKREKKHLQGQREDQDPRTLRVPATDHDSLESYRNRVCSLFDEDSNPGGSADHTTLRQAFREVRREFVGAWRSRTDHLPKLALALGELAVAVAVFGGIATTSAETFRRFFAASSGGLDLGALVSAAGSTIRDAAVVGIDALGAFPFAETVWALTFAYTVLMLQWLYNHPFVSAGVLAAAAIAVVYLDRRAPDAMEVQLVESRSTMLVAPFAGFASVWMSGVIFASLGRLVGLPTVGSYLGFLAALLLSGVIVYYTATSLRDRIYSVASGLSGHDRITATYLILRRAAKVYVGVAAPFVPIYFGVALATGKFGAVIAAYLDGSLEMQAVVGAVVLLAGVFVARQARDAYPDVRAAMQELVARKAVRAVLFKQGVPFIVIVLGYFLAVGFGLNAGFAAVIGITAGIVARVLYVLFVRARYRVSLIESQERLPSRVLVQAFRFETADGETVYYATANATAVAHSDRDELVDAVLGASDDLFEEGEVSPSVERAFADDLFRFGIVDVKETRRKLEQQVKEEAFGWLAGGEMIEQDSLEGELEEYPESIWAECLRRWQIRGELRLRNGYYLRVR